MSSISYSIEVRSVKVHKFGLLKAGIPAIPDGRNSIDIYPQVLEISIFESLMQPVVRAEFAIEDFIGLFNHFPLTGNEIIELEYVNTADAKGIRLESDGQSSKPAEQGKQIWFFAIDSISDIHINTTNRSMRYIIHCVSIEALANNLRTVQQAYEGAASEVATEIFKEHINDRMKKFFPSYQQLNITAEKNEARGGTIVIPNMHPFAAINMVQKLSISEVSERYTYLFYQNKKGFHFRTLQGLIDAPNKQRFARNNSYRFFPEEILDPKSQLNNEERIISNLVFNHRHSTMMKMTAGYFNNNFFEVNIAQKAVHGTPEKHSERIKSSDVTTIYPYALDTKEFIEYADTAVEGDEFSNRTHYTLTTRAEHDQSFPISRARQRWGKDIISNIGMAQIDFTVTIPGTTRFTVGDLFYIDLQRFDGFTMSGRSRTESVVDQRDDLVSGLALITEIKHIILKGGYHSTTMRLNKDSYMSSIDREARYGR